MKFFHNHSRAFWTERRFRSLYLGVIMLAASIAVQIFAGQYGARLALSANYAGDLFLDNLPVVNLDFLIVGGSIVLWTVTWWLMIVRPRYLAFGLKATALFIVCRAFFMSLTHIGPYPLAFSPGPSNIGWGFYHHITFQGNFFFSGHTGFPFLMALVFWDDRRLRTAFLALSALFGAAVLFAHVHYSIDVFAAPFIVYGVYRITEQWFPEDRPSNGVQ